MHVDEAAMAERRFRRFRCAHAAVPPRRRAASAGLGLARTPAPHHRGSRAPRHRPARRMRRRRPIRPRNSGIRARWHAAGHDDAVARVENSKASALAPARPEQERRGGVPASAINTAWAFSSRSKPVSTAEVSSVAGPRRERTTSPARSRAMRPPPFIRVNPPSGCCSRRRKAIISERVEAIAGGGAICRTR